MDEKNSKSNQTLELQICVKAHDIARKRGELVDLCRKRGSQYAELDTWYVDDEGFNVVDGYRYDNEKIMDRTIEEENEGEVVAYVDTYSGRVAYVNPDARWDESCKGLIESLSKEAKEKHPASVPDLEDAVLKLSSLLTDELIAKVELSENVTKLINSSRESGRKA